MRLAKVPRSFYLQPTLKVAKELLGLFLVRKVGKKKLIGRIVEVEAYLGAKDPASHAYRGRTARNEVMFWIGGHLYVYFTYGMHFCSNIVTEAEGIGHAVLLRAVEPLEGIEVMRRNRNVAKRDKPTLLCSGPARLCEAFAIGRPENGTDLCGNEIWVARGVDVGTKHRVARSTRIGINAGGHHRWRFFDPDSPHVSRSRPAGT